MVLARLLKPAAICGTLAPLVAVCLGEDLNEDLSPAPDVDQPDAWDSAGGDGGGGGGGEAAGPMIETDAFDRQRAFRRANTQHQVMQEFLHNFARNMKYSVLADSAGDIPEAERQRMMRELRPDMPGPMSRRGMPGGDADDGPTDEEIARQFPGGPGMRAAAHRRSMPHRRVHMLNAAPREHSAPEAPAAEEQPVQEPPVQGHGARRHAARQRAHSDVMNRINACGDEACVRAVLAEAHRGRQVRQQVPDGDDGEDAVLAVAARAGGGGGGDAGGEAEQQSEPEPAALPDEAQPQRPPTSKHRGNKRKHHRPMLLGGNREQVVRDALGRPMPLLFSAHPENAAAKQSSGRPLPALVSASLMLASMLLLTAVTA
eukprot:TRINITY_DN84680_c0_g1_i1.p1 TRINITY_DN84680_c0_g1~~TRINITY_DN84680_c0_g1_i1.p1  ORF type:complete len:373 (-),score=85.40 TRINITY_DN84680_c0_g1_i1:106-1224(-)